MSVTDETGSERLRFDCPRCGREATARFYGPCETCRAALRSTQGVAGRDEVAPDYEPKVNMTPNAVALKDE